MKNFTRFSSFHLSVGIFLLPVLLLMIPGLLVSQTHTLTINSPGSVAGEYQVFVASFGPSTCEAPSISGELALTDDGTGATTGCDAITNDLTGKIAVIDRGDCSFATKALNAEDAGAIAVIICNNVLEDNFPMGGGDLGDQVSIPSYMLRLDDCNLIRTALTTSGGAMADIDANLGEYPEETVVWGDQPGEGDFDGGLNGWVSRSLTCAGAPAGDFDLWRWDPIGSAPNGACGGAEIFSPSKCNGAMIFESDFYDSDGGVCGQDVGVGPCPAGQVGELISPPIDLTGSSASNFNLRFFQVTRQFGSTYWVGWSVDDGVTWDSVEVNTDIATNDFNSDAESIVKVPLPGVTNATDKLRVKFRYEANYYLWVIDDVQIIEQPANDMRVNSNFFAVPQNLITPQSQIEPISFLADVENIGAETQTNVELAVSIEDRTGMVVYDDTLQYGDIPGNTIVENVPFEESYMPSDTGVFFGTYEISADQEDTDPTNNTQQFAYIIGDTIFAKEIGITTGPFTAAAGEWESGEPHGIAFGNYFYVPNGGEFVRSVSFGIGNASELAGTSLSIVLYKWAEDTNEDFAADPDEREFVDFNFYVIQGTEQPNDIITIPFPEPGAPPVMLEDDTPYLLMVQYNPPAESPTQNFFMPFSDFVNYGAMNFVTTEKGMPRFAPALGISGNLDTEPFSMVGFGLDLVPVVRMNIGTDPTTRRPNVQVLKNQFVPFPNPTSDRINVQLGLEETAKTARVRIFDIAGRLMLIQDYENVQRETLSYDLSGWNTGTYIIELSTDKGTGTQRFILAE